MAEPWEWGAVETVGRVRAGEATCVDVVESHLARMAEANPAVNAVTVDLSASARREAEEADRLLASGAVTGLLHGVPVTIKENVDVAGQATTNGLPALADNLAEEDSPLVESLRSAGAILIGRTNTPEFSYRWCTDNPLRGTTHNPWHDTCTPGGSSGGAGAAVALGIGCIAHGNDLGGSLRYPAYCCGVATVRPTLGRVPAFNRTAPVERTPALQLMSVQGPIARRVADVRLGLEVMARPDQRDPWYVPAPAGGPEAVGLPRVAVCVGPPGTPPQPEVAAAVDTAAGILSDAGYDVAWVEPPNLEEMADRWRILLGAETRSTMLETIRQMGSPDVNNAIDWMWGDAPEPTLTEYVTMLADRTHHLRDWQAFMEERPLLLSPVSQELPIRNGDDVSSRERMLEVLGAQTMLVVANYLGLPAAAVPTGVAGGIPVGVQVMGPRFREDLCLDAAEAVEQATGVLAEGLWGRT